MSRTLAIALVMIVVAAGAGSAAADGAEPYSLTAHALLGFEATDLYLTVSGPADGVPDRLEMVQVKALPLEGGDHLQTRNYFDVPAPGGVAVLHLDRLARHRPLQLLAHVKEGRQHNVEAETRVLMRPDLTVTGISVPADIVRRHSFAVTATVAEIGGDTGASVTATLFDGTKRLGSKDVAVEGGGSATVVFDTLLGEAGRHDLRVVLSGSSPAQANVANDEAVTPVDAHMYTSNGVVATDHGLATQIGADVLERGGNAFDAAVAVQFALNVTQPHLSGIGGGSNIVVRDSATGELFAIDARETAPAATAATTYAGLQPADVRPNGFAVGVPGTLRAIDYMLERWGTKTLGELIAPSIVLAEDGFPIGQHLAFDIARQRGVFQPETSAIFLNADGSPRGQGEILKQPDLAKTFRLLAQDGVVALYDGEIAAAIVAAQRRATAPGREGRMTLADLHSYGIDVERPLSLGYRGYDVYAPGPSTNGGLVLLESLGLIREFRADTRNHGYAWGFGTRNSLHVFIEAMRLAFADRDYWIGDDRYTNVPARGLLDSDYLRARSTLIEGETVMCNPVAPGNPILLANDAESSAAIELETAGHTTHFSIIDRWGNVVVMTSTLRNSFGTGITVPGYGFQLNDSLGLFNRNPVANPATGNPGANDAAGGKRPMGSMTPTLILRDGEPFTGTGSLGADFIPSVVLNVVLNRLEYELSLQQAIDAPRLWMAVGTGAGAGAAQLNFGLHSLIMSLRAMGHVAPAFGGCAGNLNQTPLPLLNNLGSTGSFGVDLTSFDLEGGADKLRFPDAAADVVERT
jgi:gamma-glutamyltranspeptidase / glutathione hydrolase